MKEANETNKEKFADELFRKIQRYHSPNIASIIVGIYLCSLNNMNKSTWPREGQLWIRYLQRQHIADKYNPVDVDNEYNDSIDLRWKEEYLASALHLVRGWDKEVVNTFVKDIANHPTTVSSDFGDLMKWSTLMMWMEKKDLLDGVERELINLFHVKQEQCKLEEIRDLLTKDRESIKSSALTFLQGHFFYTESLEIIKQLNSKVIPLDAYLRVEGVIERLKQQYLEDWEALTNILENMDQQKEIPIEMYRKRKPGVKEKIAGRRLAKREDRFSNEE